MYDERQLAVAREKLRLSPLTCLHVDITGNMVMKWNGREVFNTACIFRGNDERSRKFSKKSSNHPPLVVAEMMSVRTNRVTLCHFLTTMNEDLLQISNGSAVIRHVECDYSLPLLGATCQTFNEMSLALYRKVCYEAINNREQCESMKVLDKSIKAVVHICSNHNLHSWKRYFERKGASDLVKKTFMGAMCRMMMARDYELIKKIFYNLAVVSLNTKLTKAVQESINYITEICGIDADVLTLVDEAIDKNQATEFLSKENICDELSSAKSPFLEDFRNIYLQVIKEMNENTEKSNVENKMHFKKFVTYFLRTWASNIPLWTAIILHIAKSEVKFNNQPVESWFSSLKHKNMDKKKHRKEDNAEDDDGDVDGRWSYHTYINKTRKIYNKDQETYMLNQAINMTELKKMPQKRKNVFNVDDEWDTSSKKKKKGNNQTKSYYQHAFKAEVGSKVKKASNKKLDLERYKPSFYTKKINKIISAKETDILISVVEDKSLIEGEIESIYINHKQFKSLKPGKLLHDKVLNTILRIKLPKDVYIIESDQLRRFILNGKGLIEVNAKLTEGERIVSFFKDDKNNFKLFIVNKLKNEWTLIGYEDDDMTLKGKLEKKINKIFKSKRHQIKEIQYKYSSLGNDEESSLNVIKYALEYFTKSNDKFTRVIDYNKFKLSMAEDILRHGGPYDIENKLSKFCFLCGSDQYEITKSVNTTANIEWRGCEICGRYFHLPCLNNVHTSLELSGDYKCKLCS